MKYKIAIKLNNYGKHLSQESLNYCHIVLYYMPQNNGQKNWDYFTPMIVHFVLYKALVYRHSLKKIEGMSMIIYIQCVLFQVYIQIVNIFSVSGGVLIHMNCLQYYSIFTPRSWYSFYTSNSLTACFIMIAINHLYRLYQFLHILCDQIHYSMHVSKYF